MTPAPSGRMKGVAVVAGQTGHVSVQLLGHVEKTAMSEWDNHN